jgi:choline dehydrogenase
VPELDALILGGGPAGCVLAARLSEDPARRVALVEAGPDYGPRNIGRWPAELLDASAIPDSHDWWDPERSLPWARVIGGCSAHNACGITQAAPPEYDSWARFGGELWTWGTIEPCLARAREALGVRTLVAGELGLWQRAMLESARTTGLPALEDLDQAATGVAAMAVNAAGTERHNAAFAYLDPARGRPNLSVYGETLVDRVLVRDGRATGALVHSPEGSREIGAGLVIVAAGAYGSPALLIRSGIGPEADLARLGIAVERPLAGVGTGLADHCRVGLGFELSDDALDEIAVETPAARLVAQTMAKWTADGDARLPDGHMFAIVPPDRSHGRISVGLFALSSSGRVSLSSSDPAAVPVVENRFLSDPADLARMVSGLELAREVAATAPLAELVAGEIDPGRGVRLADHATAAVATYYHPTGSCRMGPPGDDAAVVDDRGRVHGVEGLLVADASIVPVSPRAGTQLTVLAVAERIAELISG